MAMNIPSWLPIAQDSPYSLANLPIGVVSISAGTDQDFHSAILVGSHVLLLDEFARGHGGMNHAINAGSLVRSRETAVNPNYHHLPEAYHSRASSVVVSGTPIMRPSGQINLSSPGQAPVPVYAPSSKLDFELELGAIVCQSNAMGYPIPIEHAEEAVFGFVLLNDWSARDIQQWEYVPLGPFNGKNFATSISAWVVMADALEPFRCPGLARTHDLPLLPYLQGRKDFTYNLDLKATITTKEGDTATICNVNASNGLVYSFEQMLAHHTSTGCPMRVGDLLGSGTISGVEPGTWGCLLETTQSGKHPVMLGERGVKRTWLEDGDTVTFTAQAVGTGAVTIGFGPCNGTLLPALVSEPFTF